MSSGLVVGTPAPARDVVLAESSPEAILAGVSLARRLPGGAELMFATRNRLDDALAMPAHANRTRPYRLFVVGPDLPPSRLAEVAAAFERDPASSIHWLDTNDWTDAAAEMVKRIVAKGRGGAWGNDPALPHPFGAIDSIAQDLALTDDPFTAKLRALADGTLPEAEEREWGEAWRDALAVLGPKPLELVETTRPLLHGVSSALATLDRGEGESVRREIDALIGGSHRIEVPAMGGKALLLVLPRLGKVPAGLLAHAALAAAGRDLALVLYDRADLAQLEGARRSGAAPFDVRAAAARLFALDWLERDRQSIGSAVVRFRSRPADAFQRLVAALA